MKVIFIASGAAREASQLVWNPSRRPFHGEISGAGTKRRPDGRGNPHYDDPKVKAKREELEKLLREQEAAIVKRHENA